MSLKEQALAHWHIVDIMNVVMPETRKTYENAIWTRPTICEEARKALFIFRMVKSHEGKEIL